MMIEVERLFHAQEGMSTKLLYKVNGVYVKKDWPFIEKYKANGDYFDAFKQ